MTGAAALALPAWLRPDRGGLSLADAARHGRKHHKKSKFARSLPIPDELTNANLTIDIVQRDVQLMAGRKTQMWTYGGTYPGPTIRRPAGEATTVTFRHKLPPKVGELTTHLHGGHNKPPDDGYPGGLTHRQPRSLYCDISPNLSRGESGNEYLIEPGDSRTYEYEGMEDGEPERGAFQWYHDHRLDHTSTNSWHGLTGMWIIDDPSAEVPLNLPTGKRDVPLMITDRTFDKHNQLTDPFKFPGKPPLDQVTGKQILVNGAVTPHASVSAQRYRLRLLNTSSFRSYNFHFEGGLEMVQICSEAGLMPKALTRSKILIGPAQRVEIVVDFAKLRGKTVKLISSARSGPSKDKVGSKPYIGDIMQFRVGSSTKTDTTSTLDGLKALTPLRPLPQWALDAEAGSHDPTFTWSLEISSNGLVPKWLINGKTFDPAHVETQTQLGQTYVWKLKNTTGVAHLLHLHHTDWYMLSRNGATPPPDERCLKETFFLDPKDEVVIAGKMSGGADPMDPDYLGKYVVHCHMLDHEDHGLMSQFEIV